MEQGRGLRITLDDSMIKEIAMEQDRLRKEEDLKRAVFERIMEKTGRNEEEADAWLKELDAVSPYAAVIVLLSTAAEILNSTKEGILLYRISKLEDKVTLLPELLKEPKKTVIAFREWDDAELTRTAFADNIKALS